MLSSPLDNCVTVINEVSVPVPAVVLPVPVGKEMTVVCPEVSVVVGDPVPVSVVVGDPVLVSVLVSVAVPPSVVLLKFKIQDELRKCDFLNKTYVGGGASLVVVVVGRRPRLQAMSKGSQDVVVGPPSVPVSVVVSGGGVVVVFEGGGVWSGGGTQTVLPNKSNDNTQSLLVVGGGVVVVGGGVELSGGGVELSGGGVCAGPEPVSVGDVVVFVLVSVLPLSGGVGLGVIVVQIPSISIPRIPIPKTQDVVVLAGREVVGELVGGGVTVELFEEPCPGGFEVVPF